MRSTALVSALAFFLLFAAGVDDAFALLLPSWSPAEEPPAAASFLLGFVPHFLLPAAFGGGALVPLPLPKKLRIEGYRCLKGKKHKRGANVVR